MNKIKPLTPASLARSFKYALAGLNQLLRREPNARIHFVASIGVILAGIVQHISTGRWLAIIFAIGIVWMAEAFNTAIELLCDACNGTKYDPAVKAIKDISAAAVLVAAITSVVIALVVFI